MSIFEFEDYKGYFNSWVSQQPKGGHGEYRRLALAINVSTTMISQVFRGEKHLSLELAQEISDYMKLSTSETEYLLLLVEFARAGSYRLKENLLRMIKARQQEARSLKNLMKNESRLTDEDQQKFYSSWMYSGVRLVADLDRMNSADEIAAQLSIDRNQVQKILEFLIRTKLVIEKKDTLQLGPARTHIPAESPLVIRHHQNWRLRALDKMLEGDESHLFFTAPMSLSQEVAYKIRQRLPNLIKEISDEVAPSSPEEVRCLNIDWFSF